jgi:hypothetical protein
MTTIQLDDKTLASLANPNELVAVTDAAGNVVGFFAPIKKEYAEQYAELAAKAYAAKGRPKTTAEVIADLEALGSKK